jgi:hypothetical protein
VQAEGEKDYLEGSDSLPACEQWLLPCQALDSCLWDSIVVDEGIKRQLLGYGTATTTFSDHGIDRNIISWNRMLLLHGPPGTG